MHVPVGKPLLGTVEQQFVTDALARGEISGFRGGYGIQFEQAFAAFCTTKEAVTCNSGTTALHLALATLKIGKGDEVIVSDFTNMASFFAVLYVGATPVPIDSEPETLNMDVSSLESKVTSRTRAIMPVHIYGHPVDMDPVLAVARKHGLYVIEDAAEAHGAEYRGKRVGSLGDIGCFSFYANKVVTTGEGGALTMNDQSLAERARSLRALAFGTDEKFQHRDIGYGYRMTNLQAALGAAQMTHADELVSRKRAMAAYYLEELAELADVIQLPVEKEWAKNVYWMFNIVLRGKLAGKRKALMDLLEKRGVETREDFIPFSEQKIFIARGLAKSGTAPVAANAGVNGFYLPSGTDISEDEQAYVVEQLRSGIASLL